MKTIHDDGRVVRSHVSLIMPPILHFIQRQLENYRHFIQTQVTAHILNCLASVQQCAKRLCSCKSNSNSTIYS